MRRKTFRCHLFAATAVLLGCAGAITNPGSTRESVTVNGIIRHYDVHLPAGYKSRHAVPLVILLHGHGSSGSRIERSTGMSLKADQENFIVAYPYGLGSPTGWQVLDRQPGVNNDVAFIDALIDTLQKLYAIDPKRIYIAGHSNGAMMAYRLGVVMPERIAAIGVVAGLMPRALTRISPAPAIPVSVVAVHGKADRIVPYDGRIGERDWSNEFLSVPASLSYWARRNRCGQPTDSVSHGTNLIQRTYSACDSSTAVKLFTLADGTHKWPGDRKGFLMIPVHDDISATDQLWEFFRTHQKP